MASNKIVRFGPVGLGTTAANIINPPAVSGGAGVAGTNASTYIVIKHLRIVNRTGTAATFSLWIGATAGSAGGTEFMGNATSVAANSYIDWYGLVRLEAADFLTGLASATASLTLQGEGEMGIV